MVDPSGSPAVRRLAPSLVAASLTLVACGGSAVDEGVSDRGSSVTVTQAPLSPEEDVPSALDDLEADGLPRPLVDPSELRSGGPPPDGIAPIDEPRFQSLDEASYLTADEPVLALEIDGDARAYPIQIMIWHEIVNDTVGGAPVSVTYCPLCNSAVAVDRRVGGRTLTFGTSGLLYQSSLVMYDRQTESLWSHFTGQALAGVLTGTELDSYPVATVSWSDWSAAHPDGRVLSRDTGSDRSYGTNPYPGYDDVGTDPFLFDGDADGRLAAKERVVGMGGDTDPTAVRQAVLLDRGVIALKLDGEATVAWALPGTASALDVGSVEGGRDVGATGVFRSTVDGQVLTFERTDGGFTDRQTASRWDVLGQATDGPLAGRRLDPVEHVDTFWFAWAAFRPETTVVPAA